MKRENNKQKESLHLRERNKDLISSLALESPTKREKDNKKTLNGLSG